MSRTEGVKLTCNLCGATVFLARTGTEIIDGGYGGSNPTYEQPPKGWNGAKVYGYGDLCPSCSESINRAIEKVISETRGSEQDGHS